MIKLDKDVFVYRERGCIEVGLEEEQGREVVIYEVGVECYSFLEVESIQKF